MNRIFYLPFFGIYPFLVATPCLRLSFSTNIQQGKRKCCCYNFGRPISIHLPSRVEVGYDFNLEVWMTGNDFNYWYFKINNWRKDQNKTAAQGYRRQNFFSDFFYPQGSVWYQPWYTFKKKMYQDLATKSEQTGLGDRYFINSLYDGLIVKKQNFSWFAKIFTHIIFMTNTTPIKNRFLWNREARENGCIVEFPFIHYPSSDKGCPFALSSGIKMFLQTPEIAYNSVILRYFYFTPFDSFDTKTFEKKYFLIEINSPAGSAINQNEDLILTLLKQYMNLRVRDVKTYINIATSSLTTKIVDKPQKFWVYFLTTDGSNKLLNSLPFGIVRK